MSVQTINLCCDYGYGKRIFLKLKKKNLLNVTVCSPCEFNLILSAADNTTSKVCAYNEITHYAIIAVMINIIVTVDNII